MTEELKTIKDLEKIKVHWESSDTTGVVFLESVPDDEDSEGFYVIEEEDLRQEAIKRVKYYQEEIKMCEVGLKFNFDEFMKSAGISEEQRKQSVWTAYCKLQGKIELLKEMFNLTVEDLK